MSAIEKWWIPEIHELASKLYSNVKNDLIIAINNKRVDPNKYSMLVVQNNTDIGSIHYVDNQEKKATELGIKLWVNNYGLVWNPERIYRDIKNSNKMQNLKSIFISNPMIAWLDLKTALRNVDRNKDIDGLTADNNNTVKNLQHTLEWSIIHPTGLSVFLIGKHYLTDLEDKNIIIIGETGMVWSMTKALFQRAWANVIGHDALHETDDALSIKAQNADAIVSAIPVGHRFSQELFSWFAGPIIDVTTAKSTENNKTIGSIQLIPNSDEKILYIPAMNWGVGTTTTAILFTNYIRCIINQEIAKGTELSRIETIIKNDYSDIYGKIRIAA
jgi:5,10-methylene-tetrahydrofolate dehydrogenase/methenyl tetrahydrofolate cyclohydrolase